MAGRENDQLRLEILKNCSRDSDDLPPVTDLKTGLVYKNEYCAICHQVSSFRQWGYHIECNQKLYILALNLNFTLTADIIQQWCLVCGFREPNLVMVPAATACVHHSLVSSSCLEQEDLQARTGVLITEQLFHEMLNQCKRGPYNPVRLQGGCTFTSPFRNQYCALCNGVQVSNKTLSCVNPYSYQQNTNYCKLQASTRSESVALVAETPIPASAITSTQTLTTPASLVTPPLDPTPNWFRSEEINDTLYIFQECSECKDIINPYTLPFTIFGNPKSNTRMITLGKDTFVFTTTCGEGEVFDYVNNRCRKTACQELTEGETCTVTLFNASTSSTNGSINYSFGFEEGSLIQLNNSEFTILDNETLNFGGEVYEIVGYTNGSPVIYTNFSQNGTSEVIVTVFFYSYPVGIIILTYVGCLLSVIGCVIVLLTYSLFKELWTLPGKILMNLSAAILAISLFLLAGIPLFSLAEKEKLCHMTAIFLHCLALSQFSWMTVMSCELSRTMTRASRLRQTEAKKVK